MVLAVSISPAVFRHDSTILPIITATDNSSDSYVKIYNWLYLPIGATPFNILTLIPPNRTKGVVPVFLRNVFFPEGEWELDMGVVEEADRGIHRTSGEGYAGAYYDTPLDADKCSIQGKATSINLTVGISLQDSTETISHNYNTATVAHSITLGQNGQGSIRELGQLVPHNATFKYAIDDKVMIEIENGIARYYLISSDGTMRLLRTTRSKLTTTPKAEVLTYFTGSYLSGVLLFSNAEANTSFENIGVASDALYWQKWENQRSIISTADVLEMADKESEYTYPNQKTNLKSWGLTPKSMSREDFWAFNDFVEWHGNEKEFIFVDYARKDLNGNPTEFWAKMSSAFVDATRNGCQFEHSQAIIESFRNDFYPREDDTTPPEVEITSITEGSAILQGTASDNVLLSSLQLYQNGIPYGDKFLPEANGDFSFTVPTEDLLEGLNSFFIIAADYAGNTTQSNTVTFNNEGDIPAEALTFGGEPITFGGEYITFGA